MKPDIKIGSIVWYRASTPDIIIAIDNTRQTVTLKCLSSGRLATIWRGTLINSSDDIS
jgi:hypothetical protein